MLGSNIDHVGNDRPDRSADDELRRFPQRDVHHGEREQDCRRASGPECRVCHHDAGTVQHEEHQEGGIV